MIQRQPEQFLPQGRQEKFAGPAQPRVNREEWRFGESQRIGEIQIGKLESCVDFVFTIGRHMEPEQQRQRHRQQFQPRIMNDPSG